MIGMEGLDLADVRPNDRLELVDGSTVRVLAPGSVDGHHLPVEYVESKSRVFANGDRNLLYAHEVARWSPAGRSNGAEAEEGQS